MNTNPNHDVTVMSPTVLDVEVQALLWDHKLVSAVQLIVEWIDWDQYGQWVEEDRAATAADLQPAQAKLVSIRDRLTSEFGPTLGVVKND